MTYTPLADWGVVPQNPFYDTSGTWALYVRDDTNGELLGELQDFTKATLISRFNDVGTWEVETHLSPLALELIRRRKVGIVARVGESTVLSGPMTRVQRTWDRDGERLLITGVSDLCWTANRIVKSPHVEQIEFVGSFDFVLRNLIWAGMQGGEMPPIGGVSGATPGPQPFPCGIAVRWERCLTAMQVAARQSVPIYGFDIRDLTFESWLPGNHGTIFSIDLGTMGSYELVAEVPDANWLAVLGKREGAERQFRYVADAGNVAEWWQYEDVLDASGSGDDPEEWTDDDGNDHVGPWPDNQEALQLAGEEALAEKVRAVSCRVTPIDIPTQRFGLHYGLGDLATVYFADDLEFTETISEVTITFDTNKALSVVPTVGAPQMNLETFRRLESVERRTRRLEMGR